MTSSPPRLKSPRKIKVSDRPVTPPLLPPRSILNSPAKKYRIPQSPHRPSIDAFWSADVINDWNEEFSPLKTYTSPGKRTYVTTSDVPSVSSVSSPSKSPAKRNKQKILQQRAFDETKVNLATDFLAQIDRCVAEGRVSELAESTGGIKINWSKKLLSTAGRANWRREVIRSKHSDGTVSDIGHLHHASIDLAEKVIVDEDRLINVIAHEYCHLANFMISGVKDNPHGKEFKIWARKCTKAFRHRGINVTTKHTYEINHKYIWTCLEPSCGQEYKRHSKSIDPTKHGCGACKGRLAQIQPVPRAETDYQRFVKANWDRVKEGLGKNAGMGETMAVLAKEFKLTKEPSKPDERQNAVTETSKGNEAPDIGSELDAVASGLDSLGLDL